MKQNSFDRKEESKNLTTSSLHVQARLKKGVFCKCKDHYSDQCRIATDMDTRREILKKGNICFKYLMPGHIEKNCQSKKNAFVVKQKEIIIPHYVNPKLFAAYKAQHHQF